MLSPTALHLSQKTVVITLTTLLVATFFFCFWQLRNLFFLVFSAYLVMLALQKPVKWIIKLTRLPRSAAVILAYILFFLIILLLLAIILPQLINELIDMTSRVKGWAFDLGLIEELSQFSLTLSSLGNIFNQVSNSFSAIISFIGGTFNTLISAILLIVISIHFSLGHQDFYKKVYWLTDNERKVNRTQKFFLRLERDLGGWVVGQLMLMIIMGAIVYLGLLILNVPYALPLGILAGILEIVPNIGPIIASIPAIALAFFAPGGGFILGIATLIFSFVIQELENMFIVPQVMKNTADVDPLISIILVVAGMQLCGAVGALLSIPLYITLRTFYGFWFKKKILNYL
jgi:predicted PurR-regulated permease PerM